MSTTTSSTTWNLPFALGSVLLAPLAGVGDVGFRTLCHQQGAALTYTEMISAKALSYQSNVSWEMVQGALSEEQFGVQLFGHEPDIMAAMAAELASRFKGKLALIDVNMGCPVSKVVKKGEGSALLDTPRLAAQIIKGMVDVVDVPVTAKMRRSFSSDTANDALDLAQRLEDAGAAAVCVHGRTAKQMYHGISNWDTIAEVKEAVSIPVIGNGDLLSAGAIKAMFAHTGADGAMVARGALGNPWIFAGRAPSYEEKIQGALQHLDMLCHISGVHGVRRFRKHAAYYLAGMPYGAARRNDCMQAATQEEVIAVFEMVRQDLQELGLLQEPVSSTGRQ